MKKLAVLIILSLLMIISLPLNARRYKHAKNQSVNLKIGLFQPYMDSDLWDINMENLALNKQDMQALYYAVEYERFFSPVLSFSLEGGYYYKEHNSAYKDYEYDDGSPIYQSLALRISSVELNLKIYPIGHRRVFTPYAGGGVGIYAWRYEQWGDFINFEDGTVEEGYAETKAYTPSFNVRAGFAFKISREVGVSFEAKHIYLKGELSSLFEGFEKLDMTGWTYSLGVNLLL